ncbi:MAG: site-2 protease family protein [Anaerolineae bacterium]|nr:site-2 protease family protein [Anaerolineae bacterium]
MPFALPSASTLLARLLVLLVGMPVHEWAHAWSAYQMGDDTASLQGRLSLNPLAHLDPIGSILILLTGFGWARPVPVNPNQMQLNPRTGMAISSFAGPASNFLIAMLCAVPFRLGLLSLNSIDVIGGSFNLATILWMSAQVSLGLALFNLLPVYPLDGEKVLVGLLPREWGDRLLALRPFGPYILMGVMFLGIANLLIGLVWSPLLRLLFLW